MACTWVHFHEIGSGTAVLWEGKELSIKLTSRKKINEMGKVARGKNWYAVRAHRLGSVRAEK